MSGRNPYHLLGLKKGATEAQIKEAYKVLAKKYHPDRNQNDRHAIAKFIEVKEAYDELLERKSSKAISSVEETASEFVRNAKNSRVPGYLLVGAGVALVLGALGAAGWHYYLKDLSYHRGMSALEAGDPERAAVLLADVIAGKGEHANESRLALADAWIRRVDLVRAENALAGATDPVSLALLGDVRFEPRAPQASAAGAAREAALASWRAAVEAARAPGIPPALGAEGMARAFAGFLRAGDEAGARRIAADAKQLFPGERWSVWMGDFLVLRDGGAAGGASAESDPPARRALSQALRIAHLPPRDARSPDDELELDAAQRDLSGVDLRVTSPPRDQPNPRLDFGYPYPMLEVIRARPGDWRPTTSVESAHNAIVLTEMRAARSTADLAALILEISTDEAAAAQRRRVYSAFIADARALADLGVRGDQSDAALLFRATLALVPDDSVALAGLALVARSREKANGGPQPEIDAWRRAIAVDPQRAEYHVGLARALRHAGKFPEAVTESRLAVKSDPALGIGWLDLGDSQMAAGQSADALKSWEQATKLRESASAAWRALGLFYWEKKQFPAALNALRSFGVEAARTKERGEAVQRAWIKLACLYSMQHREQEGTDAIRHATAAGLHDPSWLTREKTLAWLLARIDVQREIAAGATK